MKANMNLEVGMLAMIIASARNPDNVGKIVTLERFVKKGGYMKDSHSTLMEDAWIVTGDNLRSYLKNYEGEIEYRYGDGSWCSFDYSEFSEGDFIFTKV